MKDLMDGNTTAAWAVKLARVKCVPCFPITPQTELIETLAKWKSEGKWNGEFRTMESEHGVLAAALGAEMTGARTFTATSSQGLELMHEVLPIVSGTRNPLVMVNVSRGISAPITLWTDHNDFLSVRDCGWLMFCCETNQEVLDTIIMAYKISENKNVLLPSLVNMDGFIHSYTRMEVDIPDQKKIDKFLPKLNLKIKVDVDNPLSLGVPVMDEYSFFRVNLHKAQLNALHVIKKVQKEWAKFTKRKYDLVESYKLSDADVALVGMGANATVMKAAIDSLRNKGIRVGLLRLRVIRPLPKDEIYNMLKDIKKIAVIDQNISPGIGGIMFPEIKSCLYDSDAIVCNYVAGLGGKPISQQIYEKFALETLKTKKPFRKFVI